MVYSPVIKYGLQPGSTASVFHGSYLTVGLAAHNLDPVPLLLGRALLQLAGPEKADPARVGATAALCRRHEGGGDKQNLQENTTHS